jgi:hypothetical protein
MAKTSVNRASKAKTTTTAPAQPATKAPARKRLPKAIAAAVRAAQSKKATS